MENGVNPTSDPPKNLEAYKGLVTIDQQEQDLRAKTGYGKAYVLSIVLLPIGFYYFFKYFFFGEGTRTDRKAAVICLVLTTVSLVVNIWLIQLFFSQPLPGGRQNLDVLKELITPENQKTLQELMR